MRSHFELSNCHIYGNIGAIIYAYYSANGMRIKNCIIENGYLGINYYNGYNIGENLIIKNVHIGIWISDLSNTSFYDLKKCIILINGSDGSGIRQNALGSSSITNNIILHTQGGDTEAGIDLNTGNPGRTVIKNNLVAGFMFQQYDDAYPLDSIFIINNVFGYTRYYQQFTLGALYMVKGDKKVVRNNIILNTKIGIEVQIPPTLSSDHNLYWNLERKYKGHITGGDQEIYADPMVMKDTLPSSDIKLDMHLQAYSPAIDKGDPTILDKDGSRSDIGMYGGPLGEMYKYIDLAPREPRGLTVSSDTNYINLKWKRNTEADLSNYRLYRDTISNFTADTATFVSALTDTFYSHIIPPGNIKYYYKVSAVDSQDNESELSDEISIIVSVDDEPQIVNNYRLYQNYPNPFNPVTTISYRLKEHGYVKLMVYDIQGQLLQILVNQEQDAGYYEVEFTAESVSSQSAVGNIEKLASGIYLYRIEIIGEGNIPRYSDMKKMLMIK